MPIKNEHLLVGRLTFWDGRMVDLERNRCDPIQTYPWPIFVASIGSQRGILAYQSRVTQWLLVNSNETH